MFKVQSQIEGEETLSLEMNDAARQPFTNSGPFQIFNRRAPFKTFKSPEPLND
jgi:hypothetical protein